MPAGVNIEKFTGDVTFEVPTLDSIVLYIGAGDLPEPSSARPSPRPWLRSAWRRWS